MAVGFLCEKDRTSPVLFAMPTYAQKMPYRTLGRSGLKVSLLSFGAWVTFSEKDTETPYQLLKLAYENGVNFFDNAEGYADGQAETVMGESIQRGIKEGVWNREDLVVTTKIYFGTTRSDERSKTRQFPNAFGCSRKHIVEGLQASLRRFQLDYVDVVFCHRPDVVTPVEETVRAMNHVIDRGMAFYWGTSEWPAHMIVEACEIAKRLGMVGPIVEQPEYNILARERVEVEYSRLYGLYGTGLTTWSPLASGVLTGKYSGGKMPSGARLADPSMKWLKDIVLDENATKEGGKLWNADRLVEYAKSLGMSPAQFAIAWAASCPYVSTVILGATTKEQLEENLSAIDCFDKITPEVKAKVDEMFGKPTDQKLASMAGLVGGSYPMPDNSASKPLTFRSPFNK